MVLESGCSPDAAVMPLYIHIHTYTYMYIDKQIYRYGQALANAGAMLSAEGHLGEALAMYERALAAQPALSEV